MDVTLTGATGRIGTRLVRALRERGDEVTVLSRSPDRAGAALGVPAVAWDPLAGPAPAEALAGRDAVLHLAGEDVAQRWTDDASRRIRESRELGTRNLVAGLRAADPRPAALVSASAVGYYGKHGDEAVPEDTPAGRRLPGRRLRRLGARGRRGGRARPARGQAPHRRRARPRGRRAGEDAALLQGSASAAPWPAGDQYLPWIHVDDVVGLYLAALDGEGWSGAYNGTRARRR